MARINNRSAIGLALAGKSASVDIPSPHARRDSLTAVTTSSASKKKQAGILPTPPHSMSPDLPPHNHVDSQPLRVQGTSPNLGSDVDIHENTPQAQRNALNAEALDSLGDLDSAGAITPGMLGKHHLPDILLNHGPLAIRHIMGHLTTSVPGFSRISSAKARRLVVAALEGRGSGLEGGAESDVIFDKVGCGRWDARLKGQPLRERANVTPPRSLPSSYSHPYSQPSGSDLYGSSLPYSAEPHSEQDYEDHDMLEHEADKMSLDGNDDGYASSEPADPMMDIDLGEGEVTDEEDWASMGAAALRARSLPTSGRAPGGGHLYQPVASYSRQRSYTPAVPPMPNIAQSVPVTTQIPPSTNSGLTLPSGVVVDDSQERAAIEALLSLGSL